MEDGTATGEARHDDALVDNLAAFSDDLERTIANRPVEDLLRPASDGGWGVIENLCHLRDWDEIFIERARAWTELDRPALPAYDDELWAIERDYRGQDPARVVQQFRELRGELVKLLRENLRRNGWSRVGDHAIHGEVTLRWLAETAQRHGDAHLAQIRDALA